MGDKLLILGAGGHAKVVMEILLQSGLSPSLCIAEAAAEHHFFGVPVTIGDDQIPHLVRKGFSQFFPAIGSNKIRVAVSNYAMGFGLQLVNAISPSATISPSVKLGDGLAVMPGAVINASTTISDLAIINTNAAVDHDCQIGIGAHVAPGAILAGNVTIGEGAFVCAGAKLIPGVTVGAGSIVAAGAVVISDVPARTMVAGVPAKFVKLIGK